MFEIVDSARSVFFVFFDGTALSVLLATVTCLIIGIVVNPCPGYINVINYVIMSYRFILLGITDKIVM